MRHKHLSLYASLLICSPQALTSYAYASDEPDALLLPADVAAADYLGYDVAAWDDLVLLGAWKELDKWLSIYHQSS